ncbi:MAG TPA: hypothetical protein PLS71_03025 [Leptospiraceae bacterium]|nr:hypothetical protein [Leptospiraceae bacterium]HNB97183.1 hypothetical protein [Leptospiraceae bacterium]HNH02668.1 hypothetical protein [Leptospiraceae bacterium]HNI90870.1 hypothetical protein [Leptospiraceae bacterium]
MNIRSTYAFDEETIQIIKSFSKEWKVSQAEVIRRSVRIALQLERKVKTPMQVLNNLDKKPPLTKKQAKSIQSKIKQSKLAWD